MSIVALALRMALTRELRGRTIAGPAVFEAAIQPIDTFEEAGDTPFITVAIEDQESTDLTRADLTSGERSVEIVVEVAAGRRVSIETPDGQVEGVDLQATDAVKELTLDLLHRQILRAVAAPSDERWGPVLDAVLIKVDAVKSKRGLKAEGSARLAFRQIVFEVTTCNDPEFGAAPYGIWDTFLAACEADQEAAAIAPAIRSAIVGEAIPAHMLEWRSEGTREDVARAAQLLHADGTTDAPPLLDELTVEDVTHDR